MPHDNFINEEGRPPMRILSPTEDPIATRLANGANASGITAKVDRCLPEQQRDRMNDDMREELVRLLPRLRRFAYSLSRDGDKCNDLVQETCARALSKLEQWEPGTRFDSWLFRIAQNIWFDRMRSEKSHGQTVDIDTAYDIVDTDGRDVTENRLTLQEVNRGIAKLAVDQQVLVALVCVDGMSYKEAAEVLGLPIGTVMSRLSRARLALHQAVFGDTSGDDGGKGSGWQRGRGNR
ncbi:MAG: RNA polymerase sigma factor [Hyphomicrobium sp.]